MCKPFFTKNSLSEEFYNKLFQKLNHWFNSLAWVASFGLKTKTIPLASYDIAVQQFSYLEFKNISNKIPFITSRTIFTLDLHYSPITLFHIFQFDYLFSNLVPFLGFYKRIFLIWRKINQTTWFKIYLQPIVGT